MNTKKTLLAVGGGLATAGLGYLVYMLLKKKPKTFGELTKDVTQTVKDLPSAVSQVAGKYTDDSFPLKKGSGGERVKSLQKFLNASSGYSLVVDGKFGNQTESAVIQEQSPFSNFKSMYPDAVKGQVSQAYFDLFIKGKF
jgi:peptidoglycan hydrolase-like protein with peptidoglycan-binding domain